jgi:hypothetical protein
MLQDDTSLEGPSLIMSSKKKARKKPVGNDIIWKRGFV